jgi:DNA-binding SARP family transcriptional activator
VENSGQTAAHSGTLVNWAFLSPRYGSKELRTEKTGSARYPLSTRRRTFRHHVYVERAMQSVLNGSLRAISVSGHGPSELELEDPSHPVLLCLLGRIRLLSNGRPVAVKSGGKLEALLVQLGLASWQGIRREALLAAVWPESDATLAGHALNTLVHRLRDLLGGSLRGASPVVQTAGYYRLNHEEGVSVDVARFKALVAQADHYERTGQTTAASDVCERAVALYCGDLSMLEDGGAQSILERAFLRATYLALLMRLSDFSFAQGHFATCLSYARRLLAHDPCREDAHRLVMRCYVRRAERAQALRHYRIVQEILHDEFDAVPEPATTALFAQVRLDPGAV